MIFSQRQAMDASMETLRLSTLCGVDGRWNSFASNTLSLDDYFNPTDFEDAARIAVEKLTGVLEPRQTGGVELRRPKELTEAARALMTGEHGDVFNAERFSKIVDLYIDTGINLNSRGYMARQFSSVLPVSAVFDMVSAMSPQPASYYEAGQLANVADKIIAQEFGRLIGWADDSFEMVTTSGATLANTTAVLTARNRRLSASWNEGMGPKAQRGRPAIAIGEDAHFSVSRIAGIIGVGQDQVVRLPLNDKRQICIVGAKKVLQAAAVRGLDVFCLIASAGTTSVGANDPLVELAELARQYDAWFHVDAAHNGAFLVSDRLRPRLSGIELADSFCLDAHKTLFVPALCTLLFYREKDVADSAFPQKDSYVFDPFEDEMSNFQSGIKNFECTKRPAIMNLWLAWALYGRAPFEQKLDHLVALTEAAHSYLNGLPDFEVMHEPETNILCFKHTPSGIDHADLSHLQLQLRNRVRAAGHRFISKVDLDGATVLRIVLMNHQIERSDIADLVEEIRSHAQDILAEQARLTDNPDAYAPLRLNVG
jgi:L-2,4-diaminobutyrate decarboxylase